VRTDSSSIGIITTPVHYMPICTDQAARSLLLKVIPTLDDINIAAQESGDQSHGVHIFWMDDAINQGSAGTTTGPSKGKEKIALSESASKASSNTEMSFEGMTPLVRRMRLACSNRSTTDRLPLPGQHAPKQSPAMQPILKVAASTMSGGSKGSISITTVKEAIVVATAMAAKQAMDTTATKEVVAEKKAVEEATAAEEATAEKKVVEEAEAVKVAKEATAKAAMEATAVKKAAEEAMALKAAKEATMVKVAAVVGPDGSNGGSPDMARSGAREAPDLTPDPKAAGKRPAAMTGSCGSSPPSSAFAAIDGMPRIYCSSFLFALHPGFLTLACVL
jgi:hypothetical protein